jgi:hypothetical protein
MTTPDATRHGRATFNTAESWSKVGIQAEEVHNSTVYHDSTVYQVHPDATAQEKYRVGVRFLEDGVPAQARKLIHDAIIHGHDNSEVRFHWVLAMLSKRSYRDLTSDEREQLEQTSKNLRKYGDDEWKRALETICELLDSLNGSGGDPRLALQDLRALQPRQRDKIVRHLDLVLTGGMKDGLWAETRQAASDTRCSNGRLDRVWAYFHPVPIPHRARQPAQPDVIPGDRFRAATWASLFGIAIAYLGWLVLAYTAPLPIIAFLLALAAGYVGSRNGLEWHYRSDRIKAKDREHFNRRPVNQNLKDGFANRVDHSFTYYFNKYSPQESDRAVWLDGTIGIRNTLRDEIVEIYREQRVGVDRVNWLIGYLVKDVRKRWRAGTLREYREQYRTHSSIKAWCSLAFTALVPAAAYVMLTAVRTDSLSASIAILVVLISGRAAARRWLHIISEHRRFAEESREYERILEARRVAYENWKARLAQTRPAEAEMEAWLNCDKTMLLDEALRVYRLAWRDIIAHAFLLTPARPCKRARVPNGPWRYSKYDVRLFLITDDGVREVNTQLDFEHVSFDGQARNNFRFDAVSSVYVTKDAEFTYTLKLTLMNGPARKIHVIDPDVHQVEFDENPATLSKINLDAAGFMHTLHILEGIAAEGKGWIDRDPHARAIPMVTP